MTRVVVFLLAAATFAIAAYKLAAGWSFSITGYMKGRRA